MKKLVGLFSLLLLASCIKKPEPVCHSNTSVVGRVLRYFTHEIVAGALVKLVGWKPNNETCLFCPDSISVNLETVVSNNNGDYYLKSSTDQCLTSTWVVCDYRLYPVILGNDNKGIDVAKTQYITLREVFAVTNNTMPPLSISVPGSSPGISTTARDTTLLAYGSALDTNVTLANIYMYDIGNQSHYHTDTFSVKRFADTVTVYFKVDASTF